jgi:hypothetical protein
VVVFLCCSVASSLSQEECGPVVCCVDCECCGLGTLWSGEECKIPPAIGGEEVDCIEHQSYPACILPVCKESSCCGSGTIWSESECKYIPDSRCPSDTCPIVNLWQSIDDKTGDGGWAAPPDCKPYPGSNTIQWCINWLYWSGQALDIANFGDNVITLVACFRDFLTGAQKKAIVTQCKGKATKLEQALCASQMLKALFAADPGLVCRHHAIALESILEGLDIGAGIDAGYKDGGGHAWTTTNIGGNNYLLDAYNEIYICK